MDKNAPMFYLDKDMKRGMVKIIILSYIKNNKTYPYALLKSMRSAKLLHGNRAFEDITKSDIYNLTSLLEKEGYISSKAQLKGNKVQKVFTITKRGQSVVKNKEKIFLGMITAMKKLVKEEFNE